MMEIEAKFVLPDVETLQRLQAADHLAGLALSECRVKQLQDTYLDTNERAILAAGYACRQREQDGEGVLMTLKGLGGGENAVHRREELEIPLSSSAPPVEWPVSPVRDRVLQLIGNALLIPLFELEQTRVVRQVSQGEELVAELSLDDVHLVAGDREQTYFELEVELAPQGTEDELAAIVTCLQDDWRLEPERLSKFERALAFLEGVRSGDRLLTARDRVLCQRIATRSDLYGRRARALLALDEGVTQVEAGKRAGRSDRAVRHWLVAFRRERMNVFPARVLTETMPVPTAPTPKVGKSPEPWTLSPDTRLEAIEPPAPKVTKLPDKPGLQPDDSMAEAARKTFLFHFHRMLYHEPGTRLGEDIEALHDMRVATRRMRAAFQVFGDYLDLEQMRPFIKGLRRTGRTLGAVRDLDVFWEKTQHYLDELPSGHQVDLEPLRMVWKAQRDKARERMLAYLDDDRYVRFKNRFGEFLQTPGAGALSVLSEKDEPIPHRLRHVVPVAVHQRLAAVRAYDEWVTGPDVPLERLHQLRIAAKGLRYTVEYFREVLGPDAKTVIDQIKGLQDHLGDLQDAVVASNLLRDFLTWGTWGHVQEAGEKIAFPTEPIVAPGVASYLAARQMELQHLLDAFPQVWSRFQASEFAQSVAAALAAL